MAEDQVINRDAPAEDDKAKVAYIKEWSDRIRKARDEDHKDAFERMREDMAFAAGDQWDGDKDKYVANIVLRHVNQRKSALYAKNPRAAAKRRQRLDFAVWDEKLETLAQAMAVGDTAILADYEQGMSHREMVARIGKTLEILFHHYLDEQNPRFKISAKSLVGRTLTCGVGYVKLGFQRIMGADVNPDLQAQIADVRAQLDRIERLSADLADGEMEMDAAGAEELKQSLKVLQSRAEVIIREGLVFDFPRTTSLIIDPDCVSIKGFVGAGWVAQEYLFSADEIKEKYKVDVGKEFTGYTKQGKKGAGKGKDMTCVWQVWDRVNGDTFTICDGYCDYLEAPHAPVVDIEQFFPYFPLVFNEVESEDELFPPSDVRLLRHMQKEYNRSREGVRQHRVANRPKYVSPKGSLEDADLDNLSGVSAHEIIEIGGLGPGERLEDKLAPVKHAPIDPAMYDTNFIFEDTLRVVGSQEANFGGTSGGTATESSIAEGSRLSSISSNIDDLDDLLTDLARCSAQVMLMELTAETATRIAGAGAAWPQMSRSEIAEELYLEVVAGSSGRPNKAQEIANFERLAPTLLQIPGITPEWLAKEALRRMDDSLDLTEALTDGMPSITAMNAAQRPGTGDPATDPAQQGAQGADKTTDPQQRQPGPQPAYPAG